MFLFLYDYLKNIKIGKDPKGGIFSEIESHKSFIM